MDDAKCPMPRHGTRETPEIPNAHICLKGPDGTRSHLHICDGHEYFVSALGPKWTAADMRKSACQGGE